MLTYRRESLVHEGYSLAFGLQELPCWSEVLACEGLCLAFGFGLLRAGSDALAREDGTLGTE